MNERQVIDVAVSNIFAEAARGAEQDNAREYVSPDERKERFERALREREMQACLLQRRLARIEAVLGLDPLL